MGSHLAEPADQQHQPDNQPEDQPEPGGRAVPGGGYESHHDDHLPENEADTGHDDLPAPDAEEESEQSDTDDSSGSNTPAQELQKKPGDSEIERIEQEREERLADDNRPDNAEVDNSEREFDSEKGMFTDAEGYDDAPTRFPPAAEQGV